MKKEVPDFHDPSIEDTYSTTLEIDGNKVDFGILINNIKRNR